MSISARTVRSRVVADIIEALEPLQGGVFFTFEEVGQLQACIRHLDKVARDEENYTETALAFVSESIDILNWHVA